MSDVAATAPVPGFPGTGAAGRRPPGRPALAAMLEARTVALVGASPRPGSLGERMISRRRQFSPEQLVAGVLETVCADPSRVPPAVVGQHIEVARRRFGYTEADREFTVAARSVVSAAGYVTGRAYRRAVGSVRCPVLMLHGTLDRLIPVAMARLAARAHPAWSLVVLPGVARGRWAETRSRLMEGPAESVGKRLARAART